MSHLTLETLARLVDEEPTGTEAAHLAVCSACVGELDELRADAAALASLPDLMPPPRAWAALESRLQAEGLIHGAAAGGALRAAAAGGAAARARQRWFGVVTQLAAAIALVGLGTALGAFVIRPAGPTGPAHVATAAVPGATPPAAPASGSAVPVLEPDPASDRAARGDERHDEAPRVAPRQGGPQADVRLASNDYAPRVPGSADEALVLMRDAESAYLEALTRYAELAGGVPGGDPMARLAALEGIVLTTRAALGQAPADPVINGYHMTALAQREATLRQIAANTPQIW